MRYFVFKRNFYGYDKIIQKNLTYKQAIKLAKKLSIQATNAWLRFSWAKNDLYEVYPDGSTPRVDEPVARF